MGQSTWDSEIQQKIKNMKLFAAVLAFVNANALDERLAVISSHVDRLADATLDMDNAEDAVDEGADVQVFSEDDYCKLNSQINSALSSAARRWACDGRGKVYRQAVRRLKKVKNQYNRNHCS